MLTSLRHNLGNLLRFSGRTGRQAFWLYAMVVLLIDLATWSVVFEIVFNQLPDFSGHVASERANLQLLGSLQTLVGVMACIVAVTVVLLAASVTRRLHDRDKAGWWALPPLIFLLTGLAGFAYLVGRFSHEEPDMTLFFLMIMNNLTYLATLLVLVVLLVGPATKGPNRYGDPIG